VLLDKAEKREKVRKSKSQKDKRVFSVINQKSKAIYKFPSLHKKEREKKRIQNPKTPSSKTPPSLSFKTTHPLSLSLFVLSCAFSLKQSPPHSFVFVSISPLLVFDSQFFLTLISSFIVILIFDP
jgi:hypothetical protein